MPIATGIAQEAGFSEAFLAAIIVGGAFFGDNLSFISDTTIAATKAMDCAMKDKFKANIRIVAPAVLVVFAIYVAKGFGVDVTVEPGAAEPLKLLPYLLVLVLAIAGMDVLSHGSLSEIIYAKAGERRFVRQKELASELSLPGHEMAEAVENGISAGQRNPKRCDQERCPDHDING